MSYKLSLIRKAFVPYNYALSLWKMIEIPDWRQKIWHEWFWQCQDQNINFLASGGQIKELYHTRRSLKLHFATNIVYCPWLTFTFQNVSQKWLNIFLRNSTWSKCSSPLSSLILSSRSVNKYARPDFRLTDQQQSYRQSITIHVFNINTLKWSYACKANLGLLLQFCFLDAMFSYL